MKQILLVGLLLTCSVTFPKSLKKIIDNEKDGIGLIYSYYNGIKNFDSDSLENIVFHAPNFSADYGFEKKKIEFRGKKELPILKDKSKQFSEVWKSANQKQLSYFNFSKEKYDYEKDLK